MKTPTAGLQLSVTCPLVAMLLLRLLVVIMMALIHLHGLFC